MNYQAALEKLEALRELVEKAYRKNGEMTKEDYNELCIRYGAVEELISRVAGVAEISVPLFHGAKPAIYPNFIEAGYLSGRTIHRHEGYTQLLKVIGKVRQLAEDPEVPQVGPSVTVLIQVLRRFRECCQYIQSPPSNEKGVQDILWISLRSHFDRLEREETLPRFGAKAYRPDFGIPDLRILVEVKFIGENTEIASIQEGILADIPGYLADASQYDGIVELVYDHAQKLRDPRRFIDDLKSVEGIIEVIVVPGISLG
jgi:hypothetical protein